MTEATRTLLTTPLSAVQITRQRWIMRDLIPQGVITILAGQAGIAKSTVLAHYIAAATLGNTDGDYQGQPLPVAIIAGEDDLGAQLVPRLRAAGADLDLVTSIDGVRVTIDGETWTAGANLTDDLAQIRETIKASGSKLLVIDPIISLMRGDSHRLEDVRSNLDPLHQLANDLGIAVVCVAHFNKGGGRAGDKVSGSHAFRDIARSLMVLAVDEQTDERILTVEKSNYSQARPSLAFTVDSVSVPTGAGESTTVGCARFLGPSDVTVQDLLDRDTSNLSERSADLVEFVNGSDYPVTPTEVSEALGLDQAQARTYLARAVTAGRIKRVARGVFASLRYTERNATDTVTRVTTVATPAKSSPNATDATHVTVPAAVTTSVTNDPGYCASCGRTYHNGTCPKGCTE